MSVKESHYLKLCAEQGYDKIKFSKGFNFENVKAYMSDKDMFIKCQVDC